MAVNKNFVVKNGLEVSTNLIIADAARNKVGIGSTTPRTELDVRGGIAATDINISGVGTIVTLQSTTGTITNLTSSNLTAAAVQATHITASGITTAATLNVTGTGTIAVGVVTNLSGTNLNYSGIATAGSVNIGATQVISSGRQLQNIASLDATTTATIEAAISNAPNTFTDLNVTGISTLGTVKISSGVVTATSGVVTYYGDGSRLTGFAPGLTASIGIGTSAGVLGYGVTFINFYGTGVSSSFYNAAAGIATIYFSGGGSGSASIGIGSTPGAAFTGIITAGNLWYNSDLGRLFIYYQDVDGAQWVDAAPFNIGVLNPVSIALTSGTASVPSLYFSGNTSTGLFQPTPGQQTFVSSGASVLNVNPGGVNVTGVVTATTFVGNYVGDVNSSGVSTFVSLRSTNINATGVVTATSFSGTATTANTLATNATGTNLTLSGNLTVNGTQTTINTQILDIVDKTVGVASTSTKTALTQDGGGLVIYGPTDINFTYDRNKTAVGLNTNLAVTGIVSATEFDIAGTTSTFNASGVNVGVVTATSVIVGSAVTITSNGLNTVGVITANDYDGNFILDSYLFN